MNAFTMWSRFVTGIAGALFGTFVSVTWADTTRTQTISIQEGWNAVYLEVFPADADPTVVFEQTPIDIAASYYGPISTAQFVSDPSANLLSQAGWGVWYSPARREAFLRTLHAIQGNQPYLLHSSRAFTWNVQGRVFPLSISWRPNAYNFVGFGVHPTAGPTFDQFFSGSHAHQHNELYRLHSGSWRRVLDPDGGGFALGRGVLDLL